jgi:hypothetical protein
MINNADHGDAIHMSMPTPNNRELPPHVMVTVGFAEALAKSYADAGGNLSSMFSAFVGLVSAKDEMLCAECLIALEQAISNARSETP